MKSLKTGDLVLQDAWDKNKLINWLYEYQDHVDRGEANHALIYYKEGMCLESNFPGIRFVKLGDISKNPKYCIRRYTGTMDEDKMRHIIESYHANHQGGYSYLGLANASISAIIWHLTGFKIQVLPESKKPYCMELVGEIYEIYGKPFKINNNILTPNDGYRSKKFKTIKDFG